MIKFLSDNGDHRGKGPGDRSKYDQGPKQEEGRNRRIKEAKMSKAFLIIGYLVPFLLWLYIIGGLIRLI